MTQQLFKSEDLDAKFESVEKVAKKVSMKKVRGLRTFVHSTER
jgi:hypothetical protein